MVPKNVLPLLLALLIVITTKAYAHASPISECKKMTTIELNTDIFGLIHLMKDSLPLTKQKIEDIGFELSDAYKYIWRDEYAASQIVLNDGTVLKYIELTTMHTEDNKSIFFIFSIRNKAITRQELESQLGKFVVFQGDGLVSNKVIIYYRKFGESYIHAVYTQGRPKNILLKMSFDSPGPLEQ